MPTAPSANRNLALGTSADWSSDWTSFNGQNNQTRIIYRIYNRGLKVGDKVNVRLVLKYSDIVTAEGQTARIIPQTEGNVTHWGPGGLNVGETIFLSGEDDEVVLTATSIITESQLQNEYWNWRLRVDYVTSGHIMWKEAKAEISETATPYSQAPEDLGWSPIAPVPTQQQRYLWKFEYIYYSDGSVEVTQPTNISIAGADGTNGQTSHVHFAFADDATGGGFSLTTPKAYMGWYADFNESASNDPTKYRWSKWKGDEGAPGKPGTDGKTSYFHMAYADSADGKAGFSFTESGQQYQGYYTDFTQANSTDQTKYTWMDRRAGVEVGWANLIIRSTAQEDLRLGMDAVPINDGNHMLTDWIKIEPSTVYTLTTYEDVNEANMYYSLAWYSSNANDYSGWISLPTGALSAADLKGGKQYTSPSNATYAKVSYPNNYPKIKLERGNIFTDYTLAPEDTQEQIDSKADQSLTQDQLNALAEKNRNMEAEMAAKAGLAEIEQWKQAYDSYVAQDNADKTEAEQKLIMLTIRVAEWVKDWEDKKVQWSFLDTNMDFGEEGLRLGKKGSPTSILVSNDRIGFYSGGSEVASMSNGTLTIDNGIFAKSLQIGHYREEVYEGDKTINVIRWVD